jgi:PPOX class probable F420-dependent enzyme
MTDNGQSNSARTQRARPGAHPVMGRRLPAALGMARLAARTAPRGAREIVAVPATGSLEDIARFKRALLVTYRRDGTPVPTPVWAAPAEDALYVRTERASGKVKRLGYDGRLLVSPCTVNGTPLGPPLRARATVLSEDEEPLAEQALALRYGLGRELFERAMDLLRVDMCYLRIVAEEWL